MSEIQPVRLSTILSYWGVTSEDAPLSLVDCPTCHKIVCACTSLTDSEEKAS